MKGKEQQKTDGLIKIGQAEIRIKASLVLFNI
jgi:hypothetical protein